MSAEEARAAIATGIDVARQAAAEGFELLGFGEMGIGNTTASTAIAAALSSLPPALLVGRGAGADDQVLARKTRVVERALALHRSHLDDPFDVLARVGGLEIAAMCGFCLGGAAERRPLVVDGVIATSAAALAVRMKPDVAGYLFAGHRSAEPAQTALLQILDQEPLLDLRMRLGEGTGAAIAIKVIQAAVAAFTGMATFTSAGVSTNETPIVQQ
jgi:nicotinate-nucleotide--dimethylbenzimidazole phosphoribosyltransferase